MIENEILICRLITGEDVIGKISEDEKKVTITRGFVIIPTQQAPGKPVPVSYTHLTLPTILLV